MIAYYFIKWWKSPFASVLISAEIEYLNDEQKQYLIKQIWRCAKERGWKPRNWYELWRWFDRSNL